MNSSIILSIITFVYGLAGFLYIFAWVFKKPAAGKLASWVALVGLIGNTTGILMRWVESYQMGIGHAPFSNLYESLVFFAWTITLIYLVVERKANNRIIGAFTMPIAFLAMAYASLKPGIPIEIQPLIPALKSNWLIAHVITAFIGYAAFATAFGIYTMYLLKQGRDEERVLWVDIAKPLTLFVFVTLFSRVLLVGNWAMSVIIALPICLIFYVCVFLIRRMPADFKNRLLVMFPQPVILDELGYQMTLFGFLFLSVGIITGAVWANSAWGRYWGWDPKETWSLITWFIYATLLHARMMRGWRGKRIAYLSLVGFAAVVFTYFGVNLLPGLHSYGALGQ
ncbi:MAG: c-type cytochrome biogenesis protein CcsB [Desulfobacterales bacterium]|jgi:cytochrome c-type biogenesis protein CcsB